LTIHDGGIVYDFYFLGKKNDWSGAIITTIAETSPAALVFLKPKGSGITRGE
jgi:hypothetical protein